LKSRPKREPLEDAPKVPAIIPTTRARTMADLREIPRFKPLELGALHQGPELKSLTVASPNFLQLCCE
jgi:hypothetical protein